MNTELQIESEYETQQSTPVSVRGIVAMPYERMVAKFNELFFEFCPKLTAKQLKGWPKATGVKSGCQIRYSLCHIEDRLTLAVAADSHFTNSRYVEIDEHGNLNYEWYDGGIGICVDSMEAQRRKRQAGIE